MVIVYVNGCEQKLIGMCITFVVFYFYFTMVKILKIMLHYFILCYFFFIISIYFI